MGADLILPSIENEKRAELQEAHRSYTKSVEEEIARDPSLIVAALSGVYDVTREVMGSGYFRDAYNQMNLLAWFGLDWRFEEVCSLINPEMLMTPASARKFLDLLAEREPVFEHNLTAGGAPWSTPQPGAVVSDLQNLHAQIAGQGEVGPSLPPAEILIPLMRDKYEQLKALLNEAIVRNEAVACSI